MFGDEISKITSINAVKKLKVVCEQAPDCTTAGVEAGTLQGDMQVSFIKTPGEHTHKLTFGSIGDDYFRDNQYDR